MNEVKRHLVMAGSEVSEMVLASDYAALEAECERLREPTPAMVQAACAAFRMDISPMQAMYEALRAALAASTGQEVKP